MVWAFLFLTNGSNHVTKLTTAQPLGMLRNLEVSKGDQITVRVKGYYAGVPTNNQAIDWGVVLSNLSQSGGDANSGEISSKNSPFLHALGLSITPNGGNPDNAVPSGYLKSVFYKHDGTPVVASLKLKHLQAGTGQWQTLELSYTAPDRGYVQIFVANESDQTVYFDDLEVEHTPQLIVQENHYYPFGMELAGLNKLNQPEHRWKFQGQEEQKEFGLNWSSFKWRNADVALGRFFSVDPLAEKYVHNSTYAFSENKVTNHVELEGLESFWAPLLNLLGLGNDDPTQQNYSSKEDVANHYNNKGDKEKQISDLGKSLGKAPSLSKAGHNTLDVMGAVPGIGEPLDVINGVWYAAEGDYENASISVLAALFGAGEALKWGKKLDALSGAGKQSDANYGSHCIDYCTDFINSFKKGDMKGTDVVNVERLVMDVRKGGGSKIGYGFGKKNVQLSDHGYHEIIQVTGANGKRYIFDNNSPNGVELAEYMKNLAVYGSVGFKEGEAAFLLFKPKK